ncbi:MAG: hypothetical protein ACKVH8_09865 [Pirellulales bacterium]|jgi:hypothetical protein
MGQQWVDPDDPDNPYPTSLTASSTELAGTGRSLFDDTGDYSGYSANPPVYPDGTTLGHDDDLEQRFKIRSTYMNRWKEEIKVYYVDPDDLSLQVPDSSPTAFRAVEILIYHKDGDGTWRHILTRKRIFSYIPS